MIADGRLIFSKASSGRFPVDDEVEEIFEALKDGREPVKVEEKKPTGFVERMLGKLRG